jgi:hypothetical protein
MVTLYMKCTTADQKEVVGEKVVVKEKGATGEEAADEELAAGEEDSDYQGVQPYTIVDDYSYSQRLVEAPFKALCTVSDILIPTMILPCSPLVFSRSDQHELRDLKM